MFCYRDIREFEVWIKIRCYDTEKIERKKYHNSDHWQTYRKKMTCPFRAQDSKHVSLLGNKPLAITWGKRGVSWNALQMWNAAVVLFDPQQDEQDIRTVNNMLYKDDYNIKHANRDKWVKQIINAHVKGTGYLAFKDGESTAWPKISVNDQRTISIIDLTNILFEHRQQVRAWALSRSRQPIVSVKEVEQVIEESSATVEVVENAPLQTEEDEVPDSWDM